MTAMPSSASRPTVAARAASPSTATVSSSRPDGLRRGAADLGEDAVDVVQPGPVGRSDPDALAADLAFEAVGGVVGDHLAVVDDADLVGQRVGLLQVLGGQQHRRAVGDQPAHDVPHVLAAWPGRGRWSARPGRSPAAGRPGWRPGPGGAACRRSRSWRGAGGVGRPNHSSSSAARALASRPLRFSSWPISTRFWVPVRSSSTEAYCPVRPMVRRTPAASVDDVEAVDGGAAGVGLQQGGEHPDGGGLAGAVGAEHAEHGALAGGQVDPVQGLGGAEALAAGRRPR